MRECISLRRATAPEVLSRINQLRVDHGIRISNVIVDVMGAVGGIHDHLTGCVKYSSNARPIGNDGKNYGSLKDQLIFLLAKRIKEGSIRLKFSSEEDRNLFTEEAIAHRNISFEKDGKMRVTPKDQVKRSIKRSPDLFDSVYMRMYFDLVRTGSLSASVWKF